jgi:hypothetical protein
MRSILGNISDETSFRKRIRGSSPAAASGYVRDANDKPDNHRSHTMEAAYYKPLHLFVASGRMTGRHRHRLTAREGICLSASNNR